MQKSNGNLGFLVAMLVVKIEHWSSLLGVYLNQWTGIITEYFSVNGQSFSTVIILCHLNDILVFRKNLVIWMEWLYYKLTRSLYILLISIKK